MKSVSLYILLLLTACDFVKIKSVNEPKTAQEALTLVGINYKLKTTLVYKNFQAGQDDYMELIFDLSKEDLNSFWNNSPFKNEKKVIYGDSKESDFPMTMLSLSKVSNKIWNDWQLAKTGIYSEINLPKGRYSKVFITKQDENTYRCYLVWYET